MLFTMLKKIFDSCETWSDIVTKGGCEYSYPAPILAFSCISFIVTNSQIFRVLCRGGGHE